jgi:serine phosphatase RsbU (regulator of sigma subunit)
MSERLANLLTITDTARGRLASDDLLAEMLERIRTVLEADTVAVLLLDEHGEYLQTRASIGLEPEIRQGVRVPLGAGFSGAIAARGTPMAISRVDQDTVASPLLWERGIRTMLGAPMLRGEQVIGVLHVGRLDDRDFTDEETQLLLIAAERVAGATTAQQLEAETAAAGLLERSLMPSRFPDAPGVQLAGRYVAAADRSIGGDWYDAFTLPDGELWLVIGDVVGHGLRSAVVMGRVRSALRAYALLGGSPEHVLELTDRKVHHFEMGTMTTVLCAVSSPPYDRFEISAAGHPAPVIIRPGEDPQIVAVDTNPPLGSVPGLSRTSVSVDVPLGAVLLLYTDGLVEDRDSSITDGMDRLCGVVRADHPEVMCRLTMASMVGMRVPEDDIALLAMRRIAVPD